jgi:transposase
MQQQRAPREQLQQLFAQRKCWTIEELVRELDYSTISVRRFLMDVGYFSSFTHNNNWYTLRSIPLFDKYGLWFFDNIGFSKHGSLKKTILHFIAKSPQGLSAKQLAERLRVPCHAVLNHMYKGGAVTRFKTQQEFVYLASDEQHKNRQLARLQSQVVEVRTPEPLSAQAAVFVLVEFIKRPEASFLELSQAVAKKQVIATPEAIAQFFREHDLKKTLP